MKFLWVVFSLLVLAQACNTPPEKFEPVGAGAGADTVPNRVHHSQSVKYQVHELKTLHESEKLYGHIRIDMEHLDIIPVHTEFSDTLSFGADDHTLLSKAHLLDSAMLVKLYQKFFVPYRFAFGFPEDEAASYLYAVRKWPLFYEVLIMDHYNVCGHSDVMSYLRIDLSGKTTHMIEHIACDCSSPYSSAFSLAVFDQQRNITRYEGEQSYEASQKGTTLFYDHDSTVVCWKPGDDGKILEDVLVKEHWFTLEKEYVQR